MHSQKNETKVIFTELLFAELIFAVCRACKHREVIVYPEFNFAVASKWLKNAVYCGFSEE